MPKTSKNLIDSKEKGVFLFEMKPDKTRITVDSMSSFEFGDMWVEQSWAYECVNGFPQLSTGSAYKNLIYSIKKPAGDVKNNPSKYYIVQGIRRSAPINRLNSVPSLSYNNEDRVMILIRYSEGDYYHDDYTTIDTVYFYRK